MIWLTRLNGHEFVLNADLIEQVESIPDTRIGRHVARQLIRCGTASAPNYDEACDAESRRDFAHKLGLVSRQQVDPLVDESIELRRMLGRSLKTLRTRPDLGPIPNQPQMSNEQ